MKVLDGIMAQASTYGFIRSIEETLGSLFDAERVNVVMV